VTERPAQTKGTIVLKRKKIAHTCQKILGLQNTSPTRKHLKEILPPWQSALKWGLREVQAGTTPSGHTSKLPSPVLPRLTRSFPQVLNQWFSPWLNSAFTSIMPQKNKREEIDFEVPIASSSLITIGENLAPCFTIYFTIYLLLATA